MPTDVNAAHPFQNTLGYSIFSLFQGKLLAYCGGMTVDADGAPNAYHPNDKDGLDFLPNAGRPGNWWALATDNGKPSGKPLIQRDGPFQGFYISQTSLRDQTKSDGDITKYVDATAVPYHVLPGDLYNMDGTGRPGDFALVVNTHHGNISASIFADIGPTKHLGEGSIKLASNLGLPTDLRGHRAGAVRGILYLIMPYSRRSPAWPMPVGDITGEVEALIDGLGGRELVWKYLREANLL